MVVIKEMDDDETHTKANKTVREWKFVWGNIAFFSYTNIAALYGVYLLITKAMWQTILFAYILTILSNVGVTAGAHRLWAHKTYKAKLPLKIINLILFTLSFETTVFNWVREHRSHHKFCDTDADPHNSTRGFFFSHIGWLLVKKHPDVAKFGRAIDMSDIESDPLLRLQKKYYYFWVLLISVIIPAYIPVLWGEDLRTAYYVAVVLRFTFALHMIFLVNSAAHMWGKKPYDKNIRAVETKAVSIFATGEGFHNYHHTFPWDYKAAELGDYMFNTSLFFINMMAKIGWAYDLKTVPEELIQKRVKRSGDGTHPVWGWDDQDLSAEDRQLTKVLQ